VVQLNKKSGERISGESSSKTWMEININSLTELAEN